MAEQVVRLLEDHSKSGVYQILNTVNGKRYVGSAARSFHQRWTLHRASANRGKHHNAILQAAWNNYGASAFVFSVLEYSSGADAVNREQRYIDLFQSADRRYGYNICATAGSSLGIKRSVETRLKMSKSQKVGQSSPIAIERRKAASIRIFSDPAVRQKISDAARKRYENKEVRQKASVTASNAWANPDVRKRTIAAMKGSRKSVTRFEKSHKPHPLQMTLFSYSE